MKSKKEKELTGTYRKSREKAPRKSDKPEKILPAWYLNEKGRQMHTHLVEYMQTSDNFYRFDAYIIDMFCFWLTVFHVYANKVKRAKYSDDAFIQEKGENGYQNVSTWMVIMNKADTNIRSYFKVLGIGPYWRTKIREILNTVEPEDDPMTKGIPAPSGK